MTESTRHSGRVREALFRLEARGGWDEADLNDFAIVESALDQIEAEYGGVSQTASARMTRALNAEDRVRELEEQYESLERDRDMHAGKAASYQREFYGLQEQLGASRGLLERSLPMTRADYAKKRGSVVRPLFEDITAWLGSSPAKIREEVRAIDGPISPDELEDIVTRTLESFGPSVTPEAPGDSS